MGSLCGGLFGVREVVHLGVFFEERTWVEEVIPANETALVEENGWRSLRTWSLLIFLPLYLFSSNLN